MLTPQQSIDILRQVQAQFVASGADHARISQAIAVLDALIPQPTQPEEKKP